MGSIPRQGNKSKHAFGNSTCGYIYDLFIGPPNSILLISLIKQLCRLTGILLRIRLLIIRLGGGLSQEVGQRWLYLGTYMYLGNLGRYLTLYTSIVGTKVAGASLLLSTASRAYHPQLQTRRGQRSSRIIPSETA